MKRTHSRITIVLAIAAGGIAACGLSLPLSMDTPSGVTASSDQIEQITVSWNAVAGADRYFIYRSRNASGPFWEDGPFGPVPYATVAGTTFVDEPLDPLPYYYRVSAFDDATGDESTPAPSVSGTSLAGPLEWQDAQLVLGSFSTARLAVDAYADIVRGYVLSVPDIADTRVSIRRITNTGTLEQLGSAFADVDGTDPLVADLAIVDGTVFVALVNEADGTVEIWRYTDASGAFTRVLGGLVAADGARPLVSLAAPDETTLWLAYKGAADGTAQVYEVSLPSLGATPVSPPTAVDGDIGTGDVITALELKAGDGTVALFHEVTNTGVTDSLGGAVWDGGGWSPVAVATEWTLNAVGTAFTIDPTLSVAAAERSWIISSDAAAYYLEDLADTVNATVTPSDLAGDPDLTETSLALAADNGTLYLFAVDATAAAAPVFQSIDDGATWTEFSPVDFAQTADPVTLQLAARSGKLFAAWVSAAGLLTVRAYQ